MLDETVAVSTIFEEVHSAAAQEVVAVITRESARVPALWHLEPGQALLVAERQGRLPLAERQVALHALSDLQIEVDLGRDGRARRRGRRRARSI
jgi:hypothetical protein